MMTDHFFRWIAVLALHDTQGTAESPGYDTAMREPKIAYDAAGNRIAKRGEKKVEVRCLVETGTYQSFARGPLGMDTQSSFRLVFRARHLRDAGLLDEKGQCLITLTSRLCEVRDRKTGRLQDSYEKLDAAGNVLSGVYVVELTPSDYGYEGERDLFVARLENRPANPQTG